MEERGDGMTDLIEILLLLDIIYLISKLFKVAEMITNHITEIATIQNEGMFEALKRYDSRWKK